MTMQKVPVSRLNRTAWLLALSAAILVCALGQAHAQSCTVLKSEFTRLTSALETASKKQNAPNNRYGRAYEQQQLQLDAAEAAYKQAGCRTLLGGHAQRGTCVMRRERMDAMAQNLAFLAKKSGRDRAALNKELAAVSQQIKRRRCNALRTASLPIRPDRAMISGVNPSRNKTTTAAVAPRTSQGATYRTLCVRSCDGYYFPISFATSSKQFQTDRARCQQMCPAAQVELYYHRNPGEGPEDMMSLSGLSYVSLETAFLYRKTRVKSCACQLAPRAASVGLVPFGSSDGAADQLTRPAGLRPGLSDVAPHSGDPAPALSVPPAGAPTATVASPPATTLSTTTLATTTLPEDEDPETIANLTAGFDPLEVSPSFQELPPRAKLIGPNSGDEADVSPQADAPPGPIRQVGPAFFPDRSEVKAVPNPGLVFDP